MSEQSFYTTINFNEVEYEATVEGCYQPKEASASDYPGCDESFEVGNIWIRPEGFTEDIDLMSRTYSWALGDDFIEALEEEFLEQLNSYDPT